jgi:hypothetical protein
MAMVEQNAQWVLNEISEDMRRDAQTFDGKPFNGRTVAEYFGNQGAAIAALARIVAKQDEKIAELEAALATLGSGDRLAR